MDKSTKLVKFASKFRCYIMNPDFLSYQPIIEPCTTYGKGIAYSSMMKRQIRKHSSYLQPIFEAISNSLESNGVSNIEIVISCKKTLYSDVHEFNSIHITDNGVGFNDENFGRFVTLFDDTKGYNNFGTGRIQYMHFFKYTQIRSVYEKEGEKHMRTIVLSNSFYDNYKTSILSNDKIVPKDTKLETTVSFFHLENDNDNSLYKSLTTEILRHEILKRYLSKFCLNKEQMPTLKISKFVNEVEDTTSIKFLTSEDIPLPDYHKTLEIPYSTISEDGKSIIKLSKTEMFTIQSFPLPYDELNKNEVKLTSKGESVDSSRFDFNLIKDAPRLGESFLLFLISSEYLTEHDQDERGKLTLVSRKDFLNSRNIFSTNEIVVEDIQEQVVNNITEHYPVIKSSKQQYDQSLQEMAEFFSLDISEIKNMGVRTGESTESILRRYHDYNGAIQAKKEAQVKSLYDSISSLNPGEKKFTAEFNSKVKSLTSLVPELVRANLTGYIAQRKLVLRIFEMAILKNLDCQKNTSQNKQIPHEKFLHNIIFSQHSTEASTSNLWLLSDEFVHFSGVSEKRLSDIKYKNESFLRDDLTEEEKERLIHYEHNDLIARPDILLFPEEHKCVIIEFKSPEVELTNQVEQINEYASVIREFAKEKFEVTSFYAYLIGEKIDYEAFLRRNPLFEKSYYFDYVYCPDMKVYGGNRSKGSMRVEILQFSTLLKRAEMRNKVFLDQLDS